MDDKSDINLLKNKVITLAQKASAQELLGVMLALTEALYHIRNLFIAKVKEEENNIKR
jgi:hypothetical protein